MYNMDDIRERVILVGVDTEGGETAERSLDELAELAATAGAEVTGRLSRPGSAYTRQPISGVEN